MNFWGDGNILYLDCGVVTLFLFKGIWAIYISSLKKCLFISFAHV